MSMWVMLPGIAVGVSASRLKRLRNDDMLQAPSGGTAIAVGMAAAAIIIVGNAAVDAIMLSGHHGMFVADAITAVPAMAIVALIVMARHWNLRRSFDRQRYQTVMKTSPTDDGFYHILRDAADASGPGRYANALFRLRQTIEILSNDEMTDDQAERLETRAQAIGEDIRNHTSALRSRRRPAIATRRLIDGIDDAIAAMARIVSIPAQKMRQINSSRHRRSVWKVVGITIIALMGLYILLIVTASLITARSMVDRERAAAANMATAVTAAANAQQVRVDVAELEAMSPDDVRRAYTGKIVTVSGPVIARMETNVIHVPEVDLGAHWNKTFSFWLTPGGPASMPAHGAIISVTCTKLSGKGPIQFSGCQILP